MKPTPKKPPSALSQLIDMFAAAIRFRNDLAELNSERFRAIEDRLSRLDDGDDSAAARRNALLAVNCQRVSAGGKPTGFRAAPDGSLAWREPK